MGNLNCVGTRRLGNSLQDHSVTEPLPGRDFTQIHKPVIEIPQFAPNKLLSISALTVDESSTIYAIDTSSKGVVVFSPDGNFLYKFVSNEIGQPHFIEPWGIAVWKDQIYVSDISRHDVQIFTLLGEHIYTIECTLKNPKGIAVSTAGDLYVTDDATDSVLIFNSEHKQIASVGCDKLYKPCDVKVDAKNNVYVLDWNNPCLHIFDSTGELLREFATRGDQQEIFLPSYFALDSYGTVIISDSWQYPIAVYTPEGELAKQFPGWGSQPIIFHLPKGLAIDKHDRFIVGDMKQGIKIY